MTNPNQVDLKLDFDIAPLIWFKYTNPYLKIILGSKLLFFFHFHFPFFIMSMKKI
jgi:hypothetical protein